MGKKSIKTLKNYRTRKIKQNRKRFADLASISHGFFFKIRKKIIKKKPTDGVDANDLAGNMQMRKR